MIGLPFGLLSSSADATSYGGIVEADLLNRSTAESISGLFDFTNILLVSGYLFIDGVLQGAAHNIGTTVIFDSTHVLTIGALGNSGTPTQEFNGWQDDLRITNGVGRSSATYTAPTAAWPTLFGFPGFSMGNSSHLSAILGTDLQVSPTATFRKAVDMLATLNVDGNATFGSDVLIEGPTNAGSALLTHDDADFFTTLTNTTNWNISGATLNIVEPGSGIKTITIDGGLAGSATVPLIHWYDMGTNSGATGKTTLE